MWNKDFNLLLSYESTEFETQAYILAYPLPFHF